MLTFYWVGPVAQWPRQGVYPSGPWVNIKEKHHISSAIILHIKKSHAAVKNND